MTETRGKELAAGLQALLDAGGALPHNKVEALVETFHTNRLRDEAKANLADAKTSVVRFRKRLQGEVNSGLSTPSRHTSAENAIVALTAALDASQDCLRSGDDTSALRRALNALLDSLAVGDASSYLHVIRLIKNYRKD